MRVVNPFTTVLQNKNTLVPSSLSPKNKGAVLKGWVNPAWGLKNFINSIGGTDKIKKVTITGTANCLMDARHYKFVSELLGTHNHTMQGV